MALSEEQKQNIIEEETLRMEARRNAVQGGCCKGGGHGHGHGRCCGKAGWIVAAILAALLIFSHCHHCCGWGQCNMGQGMSMQGMPPHCQMMGGGQPDAAAPAKK
jgi:hypothetical protein